jgi:hypothetical protein
MHFLSRQEKIILLKAYRLAVPMLYSYNVPEFYAGTFPAGWKVEGPRSDCKQGDQGSGEAAAYTMRRRYVEVSMLN